MIINTKPIDYAQKLNNNLIVPPRFKQRLIAGIIDFVLL